MSFNHQVKYRGCVQVANFVPSQGQPRPGLIEANQCVKQVLAQVKSSKLVVLSVSAENGIKCVDTNEQPPKVIMRNSVYEIAHCGVDVSRPRMFTVIVGTKGANPQFFCHSFKAENKDSASRVTQATANACTKAFQEHKAKQGKGGGNRSAPKTNKPQQPVAANSADAKKLERMERMKRQSLKKITKKSKTVSKLTDDWFTPDMPRDDVNAKLKKARVGDFFIRESKSQIGDYAISVQTGKNIWTGLVIQSDDGFQLGNKGNALFDELTDLISYHIDNTFMNDDFGYPMALRLPLKNEKQREKSAAKSNSGSGPPSRSNSGNSLGNSASSPTPLSGWPSQPEVESDDEVDAELQDDGLSEAERFEKFMDSIHVRGDDNAIPDMSELDDALDSLNEVEAELEETEEEDFDPRAMMRAPVEKTISSMAEEMFDSLPQDDGMVGGADVRPVLVGSGLEMAQLGQIWMEVDQERRGKVDVDQLGLILGLIKQVQNGEAVSLDTLDPDTIGCPKLD